jgi:hypothetical protein
MAENMSPCPQPNCRRHWGFSSKFTSLSHLYPYRRYTADHYVKCGMGLWVSGKAIHEDSSKASFSCNANT